jgi:hypothetical protein
MRVLIGNTPKLVFESDDMHFRFEELVPGGVGKGTLSGTAFGELFNALSPHALSKMFQMEHQGTVYLGCNLTSYQTPTSVQYMKEVAWDGSPIEDFCLQFCSRK